jgi:multiple antibiotic resistance protein
MSDFVAFSKTVVSLFVIVDPIGTIPIFLSATEKYTPERRIQEARAAAMTAFLILTATALVGEKTLKLFGVSLASFSVGSGLLLLMLAVSMLQARTSLLRQTPEEAEEALERDALGAVPFGVPLLAGPGAISNVMVSVHRHPGGWGLFLVLVAVIIVSVAVWVSFVFALPISEYLGHMGIHVLTRLMGLILAALAVELMAQGLIILFPRLAT